MTDIVKALAFATHCLKWENTSASHDDGTFINDGPGITRSFNLDSAEDLQAVLQEFLGTRFLIQINRGTGSLFHWRVIVGVQDKSQKEAPLNDAQAEGEDLWDAIFDACVTAAGMFA